MSKVSGPFVTVASLRSPIVFAASMCMGNALDDSLKEVASSRVKGSIIF